MNKKSISAIFIIIVIGVIYWFFYRPYEVRKNCRDFAMQAYNETKLPDQMGNSLELCLSQHGIKSEI